MPKPVDGLHQGSDTGYSVSPYQMRQAVEPMGKDEADAFEWVLVKLSKLDPDAETRDLIENGLDEGWFLVDGNGLLRVNPNAPGLSETPHKEDRPPPQYEPPKEKEGA